MNQICYILVLSVSVDHVLYSHSYIHDVKWNRITGSSGMNNGKLEHQSK